MRYALISDIHGNDCALRAVLEDAVRLHVDRYLFLGDYCADIPMPNEVSTRLFALKGASFIRGNKEDYLAGVHFQPDEWNGKQWSVIRWNHDAPDHESLKKYLEMPKQISVPLGSGTLYASHSAFDFFGDSAADRFRTGRFCEQMRRAPFAHEEFLTRVQRELTADPALQNDCTPVPGNAYVFGHTHLQWYANVNGALLVNAGSCGLPLDMDARAAYTILDDPEDGSLPAVVERRVPYPIDEAVLSILTSPSFGDDSRIWYSVILLELQSGSEHVDYFLKELNKAARARGCVSISYPDDLWMEIGEAFLRRHGALYGETYLLRS